MSKKQLEQEIRELQKKMQESDSSRDVLIWSSDLGRLYEIYGRECFEQLPIITPTQHSLGFLVSREGEFGPSQLDLSNQANSNLHDSIAEAHSFALRSFGPYFEIFEVLVDDTGRKNYRKV